MKEKKDCWILARSTDEMKQRATQTDKRLKYEMKTMKTMTTVTTIYGLADIIFDRDFILWPNQVNTTRLFIACDMNDN